MSIFADYLQPITAWLMSNPSWSLFITFTVALAESFAIIGSIIPGSVTMTAIGVLAGAGIMRIDLTLLAAILGAICGDSLSYMLGYVYSNKIAGFWPFKKKPHWLEYGKKFFAQHGGKSVLIGRFVGPLRSIIPLIAGMMHMNQWKFISVNIISAIGWAILYVMPGVLIGAASSELSAESATRFFGLILVSIAGIWFLSLAIHWIFKILHSFLRNYLHQFWLFLLNRPKLNYIIKRLTPPEELNHYHTARLIFLTAISLISSICLIIFTIYDKVIINLNTAILFLTQSIYTPTLKNLGVLLIQLTSPLTVYLLYIILFVYFIYQKKSKLIIYLFSLMIMSVICAFTLTHFIISPRPPSSQLLMTGNSFPAYNILIATALYGFIFYSMNNDLTLIRFSLRKSILFILGISGLATVYLSDYWFTDILAGYTIGLTLSLIHFLMYRTSSVTLTKKNRSVSIYVVFFIGIIVCSALSTYMNFESSSYAHTLSHKKYILKKSTWWDQQKPILPLYQLNRIGGRISLMNIHFSGDLNLLQNILEEHGWQTHNETLFNKLLMRLSSNPERVKIPILEQLYENKKPILIMTYCDAKDNTTIQLTLWESNYILKELNHPIWIGSVHQILNESKQIHKKNNANFEMINAISYILPALKNYTVRKIKVTYSRKKHITYPTSPYILLIDQPNQTGLQRFPPCRKNLDCKGCLLKAFRKPSKAMDGFRERHGCA